MIISMFYYSSGVGFIHRLKEPLPSLSFYVFMQLTLLLGFLSISSVWQSESFFFSFSSSSSSPSPSSSMVDLQTVCSMCGDVGFPDKLFRCNKCRNRYQHLYCSNYYSEHPIEVCDWCQSEERNARQGNSSRKSASGHDNGITNRSEYSGDKIKLNDREETTDQKAKNTSGVPSPRPTTRRYKLLKDVMC